MFGDPQVPKRQNRPPLVYPRVQDINLPGICPGSYQHIGREPNSNSHTLMRELKIKRDNLLVVKLNEEKNRLATEKLYSENEKKAENMIFRRKVQDRVAQKIKAFKDSVDARRLKLSEFLYHEEKQAYFATIDLAQKSDSTKLEEMRQRAEEIKAKKEAKRIELLKAKKLQQYSEQSHELKDAISKKILIDSKEAQLMQIRENELKKEREKEIENMWHELTIREIKKKEDREQQELIQEKLNINELVGVWEKQIQGKHLVQAEKNRLRMEDYQELQRLKAEMKDNVDTATEQEKRKKLLYAEELKKQVELNRQIYNQRKALEDNFDMQIYDLARNEIERQENQKQDTQAYLRAEAKMYRKHMDQLRQQREEENQKYEELLQQYRNEIDDQNKEIYCKAWCAKEKLRREVLKEREEQINLKKKIAEDEKIRQEKEDEAVKQIHDTNMCLQKTYIRSERENRLKYSRDLSKQIEYNQLLKRREQEETERMYKNCIEEEEAYRKRVDELTSSLDTGKAHKFRAVLEKQCQCPNQTSF